MLFCPHLFPAGFRQCDQLPAGCDLGHITSPRSWLLPHSCHLAMTCTESLLRARHFLSDQYTVMPTVLAQLPYPFLFFQMRTLRHKEVK